MYRLPFSPLVFSLLAGTMLSGRSLALESSGSAVRVDPAVHARGANGERLLEVEGAVFMGDDIVSGPNGLAQIKFLDGTRIVVGPNARLKIDQFVFTPDPSTRRIAVDAVKGAFRFISGNSPHQAYSIRTPTMTIGVRGTIVDVFSGQGTSSVVFQSGSGSACTAAGCVDIQHTCEIYVAPAGQPATPATGVQAQQLLAVAFPFNNDQSGLAAEFQTSGTCTPADQRLFTPPTQQKTGSMPDNSNHYSDGGSSN